MKHGQVSGGSSHCGQCGLPGSMCQCSQYKEWGADGATKAGSETGDDPNQVKGNGNGNGNGNGGNSNPGNGGEKKEGGGGSFGGGGASGSY